MSLRSFPWMRAVLLSALGTSFASSPFLPRAAHAAPPEKHTSTYWDLMAQAEAKRNEGAHAEAAELYAQAYRSRPEAERADSMGEMTVRAAMTDYQRALEQDPDNLELLRAQTGLLQEFFFARQPEPAPQDIAAILANLDERLRALEQATTAATPTTGPTTEPESEPTIESMPTIEPVHGSEPVPARSVKPQVESSPRPQPRPMDEPKDVDRSSPKLDVALLGLGAASVVGGTVMIARGAWMFSWTSDRVSALMSEAGATLEEAEGSNRTEEQVTSDEEAVARFVDDVGSFEQQARATATGLVVAGSLLAAAGLGASTWGIIRLRRNRPRPSANASLSPTLTRRHLGLHFAVSF